MKNYVFIGNSIANLKAITELRKYDLESSIVLVSADQYGPYDRARALNFLAREIKEKQVLEHPESFYKDNHVRLITGQAVTRINFKRSQVFLENKEHLSYDILVLADIASPRLADIKGHQKSGVYQAVRLGDIKSIAEQVPFADSIVIQVTSVIGFLTACALSRHAQNIVMCASSEILPGILDQQSSDMLRQLIENSGVRLILDNPIEEILGDSDLKAVRFKSGKVLASDMVILDDLRLDTRPLQETGLGFSDGQEPSSPYKSNYANVYWVDAIQRAYTTNAGKHYAALRYDLEKQGEQVVREILGESNLEESGCSWANFQMKDLLGFWIGTTKILADEIEFSSFDADRNIYKKIVTRNGVLVGAVYFNANNQLSSLIQLASERINIQGIEAKLLEDGFDVHAIKSANVEV